MRRVLDVRLKKFARSKNYFWSGIGARAVLQEVEVLEFVEQGALTPQEGVPPYAFLEFGGLDDS